MVFASFKPAMPDKRLAESHLPEGWESTSLQSLVTWKKGKKPNRLHETPWPGAVPYIDIQAFEKWNIRRYADPSSSVLVDADDIVVVWDGARCGHVGKSPTSGALGSTLGTVKPDFVESDYILRFLQSCYDTINSNPRGTGIPHVEPELFWNLMLPLAPLAEQKRIVAKVEQLLARVNAAREHLAKVPEILKRFRQSVLAAACSGRLTADWRDARRNKKTSTCIPVKESGLRSHNDYFEPEELPEIPGNWHWLTLQGITDYQGGFAFRSKKFLPEGKNQVLRIGNVRPGCIDLQIAPVFVADEYASEKRQFQLKENDLLISMTGTKYKRDYGYVGLVPRSDNVLLLNQRVGRLRSKEGCLPHYLYCWLWTETYRDFFFKKETGNVNQGNVGADALKLAPAPIPPVVEQKEIVRRVESLFKLADTIEKRVAVATAQAEKLTQAILAKAFRGELVPTEAELAWREGRSYEPAFALLVKIEAQRKDVKPQRKRGGSRHRRNK